MVAKPPARVATLNMTAERRGAARLNCPHRPGLHRNEAVRGLIRRAVACEDLGQFYPCRIRAGRMRAHGLAAWGVRPLQQIERRGGARQVFLREVKVARRGGEIAVPQQALNGVHIHTAFEQVRGKRVTQSVDTTLFGDAGALLGGIEDALRAVRVHRMIGYPRAGK